MRAINKTLFDKIKYRTAEEEGKRYIEAIIPYDSYSVDLGGYKEVITRTAFNKTLGDRRNVYALFNHDDGKVLGSTRSGTFELKSEDEGLFCKLHLGNTSWANDTWELVNRNDCNTLSFGFIPRQVENRGNVRYLKSVQLEEVSFCVSQPAYEETNSVAYTRSKNMKKIITRSINIELLDELITSGELIEDKELAKELLSLIEPNVLKELTVVENKAPVNKTEREENTEEEKVISDEEKKELLELIESELQQIKNEEEEEDQNG
jgi:HK97 family phage prohead protease